MGNGSHPACATSVRLLTGLISSVVFSALLVISATFTAYAGAAERGDCRPVAELFGRAIYADELVPA